jgi:hypothetical protein
LNCGGKRVVGVGESDSVSRKEFIWVLLKKEGLAVEAGSSNPRKLFMVGVG